MSKQTFSTLKQPQNKTTVPDDLVRYMLIMGLMSAGGAVLQDTFGFTVEQAAQWSTETMARAKENLPQEGAGNNGA